MNSMKIQIIYQLLELKNHQKSINSKINTLTNSKRRDNLKEIISENHDLSSFNLVHNHYPPPQKKIQINFPIFPYHLTSQYNWLLHSLSLSFDQPPSSSLPFLFPKNLFKTLLFMHSLDCPYFFQSLPLSLHISKCHQSLK